MQKVTERRDAGSSPPPPPKPRVPGGDSQGIRAPAGNSPSRRSAELQAVGNLSASNFYRAGL